LQAAAADLLAGRAVLFLAGEDRALSFGAQGWIRHEPKEPSNGRAEAARLPVIAYDRREKTFVPHGLGVFHGDRLAGILTSRETRMFGLFCGKARAAKLQVPMEEMGLVSFTGVSAESKTSLHTVGNRVSFSVEVKARGHLMGMTKPLTRLGPDRTRAIAAATENAIRNEIAKMVRHLQELNADIMGFGELVRGNRPQIWHRLNWDEEFPRVPVRIRVRFTIVQAGTFR
ncbi:MAG: Ger(x)C family spore germination C-terminal domain-containing protein, partial [Bacteroidota bacterium]